jgi:hypothetical protein
MSRRRVELELGRVYLFRMKTKLTFLALIFALACSLRAAPLTFNELSLLVRMRETDTYMLQQLSQRRLLRPLTADQESQLKAQGASDALLKAARDPARALPEADAVAFETWSEEQKKAIQERKVIEEAEAKATRAAQIAQAQESALLYQRQLQDARARRDAQLEADAFVDSGYGYGYDGGYYPGYIYPGGPGWTPNHQRGPSAGALHYNTGGTNVYTRPGLSYYPLGTNGGSTSTVPGAKSAPIHSGRGSGGGGRFHRGGRR